MHNVVWKKNIPKFKTVGERLCYLRLREDLTVVQLARKLGYSANSFYGWEADKNAPSIWAIIDYSIFFEVSCDWILKGEDR